MWKAALACALLVGTATADGMHVFEPDGWLPDPRAETAIHGLANARVFRPPGDRASSFIAGEVRLPPGSPASAVALMLDQLAAGARKVEARTERTDEGRTIGEISLVDRDDAPMRAKVAAAMDAYGEAIDLAVGVCAGSAVAVCAPKLAWITVGTRPAEPDGDSIWRSLLLVFAIAAGLGALFGIARRWRRSLALAGSAALREHERVVITGVVRPLGEHLEAPLTGRTCVLYRARGRVFTRDAVPRSLGEPAEVECVPFAIATARGEVIVDRSPALGAATEVIVERSAPRELAFLARHGFSADLRSATTFDELAIQAGATIKIRGVVHLERDPHATDERGYRDDAPMIAKLVSVEGTPVTLLDAW